MNCLKQKFMLMIMAFIIIHSLFIKPSLAQYDPDQIKYVIDQLKAKKLLSNLVDLTQADYKQSATRADVLIACYLVVRHLEESTSVTGLNQKLTLLQNSITNLENRSSTRYPTEELLIKKVVEKVEADLASKQPSAPDRKQISEKIPSSDKVNKELEALRDNIEAIKNSLKSAPFQRIEKLEQKVNHHTIIASAAVVLSLIITIFAAR